MLSGAATAAFDDGRIVELLAGELFYIPPIPHDSWVIGNQPYVSLHFLGAEKYAKASGRGRLTSIARAVRSRRT